MDKINQEWVANSSVVILFAHLFNAEGIFEAILQRQAVDVEFAERNITWIGSDSWGGILPPKYNKITYGSLSTIPQVRLSEELDEYFYHFIPAKIIPEIHGSTNMGRRSLIAAWEVERTLKIVI